MTKKREDEQALSGKDQPGRGAFPEEPAIPPLPPSQISGEELQRLFQKTGLAEELFAPPPEAPSPPAFF